MTQLPPDVYQRIRQFLDCQSTGRIELHIKDGEVLECVFTRIDRIRTDKTPAPDLQMVPYPG